ncbi:DUF1641 domain-containing protein [Paenibacillus physcomitrellae]|uniref:DUF1641 domain-containing protein n=1 Tax=Paenibacillus physcomitrellae TaxID=1619311 RepID=A0ABQ1G0C4_9BACL|nr:DUF1641 domain-containing protein [Paenibacillus physcomitrellae]GGA32917.1 hypothetical protein GCM10010917_17500 [Paenibacillus physcomitrellae]
MSQTLNQSETQGTQETAAASTKDLVDQLLKPEVQQSLTTLVDNLPKLTEMVNTLTQAYDVMQSLATDKVFVEDIKAGFTGVVGPVVGMAKNAAATAIEANDRAKKDNSTVSVFGLLKMLKDPNIQKALKFAQAYLDVTNEKKK